MAQDTSSLDPSVLLLILTPDHKLLLCCGTSVLCQLALGGVAGYTTAGAEAGNVGVAGYTTAGAEAGNGRAVGVSHPVAGRANVTVVTGDSAEACTIRIHVPSVSSLLVRRALLQVFLILWLGI